MPGRPEFMFVAGAAFPEAGGERPGPRRPGADRAGQSRDQFRDPLHHRLAQHGVADRWTAPLATLAAGRGDCEDYAIAKYAILRAAGIPEADLRLLLVRDRAVRQDHAVLAVRDNGRWLVLDNRHLMLAETTMLPQFTPLFALDHQGVSLFATPYVARPMPNVTEPNIVEPAGAASPTAQSGCTGGAAGCVHVPIPALSRKPLLVRSGGLRGVAFSASLLRG